jgi:hypothetical protein
MAHALRGAHLAPLALAVVLALLPTAAGAASADELTCGQEPGNRFFWIERAFCDLPSNGPERANGIVIWNHGIYRTLESWRAPAPPAFRLLQARGWDVIMLKRHNLAEVDNVLYRTVRRTLQEALLLDETSGLSGHGGGVSGRFALRYGLCLADFLAAPSLPAGRFTCPPVADDWPAVRELLLPAPEQRPVFVRADAALGGPVASLVGLRWALLGDSLVLVAPVEERAGRLRLMYRSTGPVGGIFDDTITWTAADGSRSFDARLVRGRESP